MKMKCICNKDVELYLVLGRVYNLLSIGCHTYYVEDTITLEKDVYLKSHFEII